MPILYRADAKTEEGYPGIPRTILVDASLMCKGISPYNCLVNLNILPS